MSEVIAEVGCNHKGSFPIALEMIQEASKCGASIVKFQKRNNRECLRPEVYAGPHPNPINSYGTTYGEHREYLELDIESHYLLKKECEKYKVEYSCTPFDLTSARELLELKPDHVKIASFHNNHDELLKYVFGNFSSDIHISLGMTTEEELLNIMQLLNAYGRQKDTVLYWCTSAYPCKPSNLYLQEIIRLHDKYSTSLKGIGFSGHHDGIAMDLIAYSLGARFFERHFTRDHNWKGTDHKASLSPEGLTRLTRDLRSAEEALKLKPSEITSEELHNRNFHKFQKQ